ncbi:MAG: hypothetical protein ACP5O1_00285 [Phycisphaerae bacterium]
MTTKGKWIALTAVGLFAMATSSKLMASVSATGTISDTPITSGADMGDYNYTIELTNTGSQSIDFLWFAWTPGQDYLYSTPLSASAPAGWTTNILSVGGGSGASIQFSSTTMSIASGNSLDFSFISADIPSMVYSDSSYWFPGKPVGTSVVYNGAAFSTPSDTIVVTPTPEPASLGLLGLGSALLPFVRFARRRVVG